MVPMPASRVRHHASTCWKGYPAKRFLMGFTMQSVSCLSACHVDDLSLSSWAWDLQAWKLNFSSPTPAAASDERIVNLLPVHDNKHLLTSVQSMAKHSDDCEKEGSAEIQEALTVVINYAFYINDKKRELEQEQAVRVQEMQRNLAIKRKKKELRKQIQVPLKKAIQCLLHLISCTSPQITEISGK